MPNNPIARRTFTIGREDMRQLEVLVCAPVEDGGDYRCDYEVAEDAEVTTSFHAMGVDSLQAMIPGLRASSVGTVYSDVAVKRDLDWLGRNDHLGLLAAGRLSAARGLPLRACQAYGFPTSCRPEPDDLLSTPSNRGTISCRRESPSSEPA
jgi:hypothetical protein